jgi:hypothetical protein
MQPADGARLGEGLADPVMRLDGRTSEQVIELDLAKLRNSVRAADDLLAFIASISAP